MVNEKEDIRNKIDVLDNLMQQEPQAKEQKDLDVLKELFILENIEAKTDLTIDQVIMINQKRTIAKLLDFKDLKCCLDDFCFLLISKNRQGRSEFVKSFMSEREQTVKQSSGWFGNMRNRLNL